MKPLKKLLEMLESAIKQNDEQTVEKFCKILKLPDAIRGWSFLSNGPFSVKILQRLQQIGIKADTNISGIPFLAAVCKVTDDLDVINYVLKEMMVNVDDKNKNMVLLHALTVCTKAKRDKIDIKIPRLLIENGAKPREYLLLWVISEHTYIDVEFLRLLVNAGSNVNEAGTLEYATPLSMACTRGLKDVFEFLLEQGANSNALTKERYNALHLLLSSYRKDEKITKCADILQIARRLVENNVECITQKNDLQKTPLEWFVKGDLHKKYPDICKQLMTVFYRAGAIVDWKMLNVLPVKCPSLDVKDLPTDILQHLLNHLQNAILRRHGGAAHRTTTEIWSPSLTDLTKVPYDQVMNAVFMFLYGTLPTSHSLYKKSSEMYGEKCGILAQPQIQGYDKKLVLYLLEEIKKSALILSSVDVAVHSNSSNDGNNDNKNLSNNQEREPETKKLKK